MPISFKQKERLPKKGRNRIYSFSQLKEYKASLKLICLHNYKTSVFLWILTQQLYPRMPSNRKGCVGKCVSVCTRPGLGVNPPHSSLLRNAYCALQSIKKARVYSKAKYNPVRKQTRNALENSGGLSCGFEDKNFFYYKTFIFIIKCLIEKKSYQGQL